MASAKVVESWNGSSAAKRSTFERATAKGRKRSRASNARQSDFRGDPSQRRRASTLGPRREGWQAGQVANDKLDPSDLGIHADETLDEMPKPIVRRKSSFTSQLGNHESRVPKHALRHARPNAMIRPASMEHRTNQLVDRRRRVLTDEVLASAAKPRANETDAAPAARPRPVRATTYGKVHLFMDRQPRIIDLAPSGYLKIALLVTLGLLAIAGLEALYYWMPALAQNTTDGRIEAFDLDGEGSLSVWFSSTLLLAAACMALVIHGVRRHRQDDYHGRYRIWLAAAFVWLAMSLDETASLHEGFKEMLSHYTGQRLMGDGSLWWVMAYALVLGYVGLRLFFEMRACRGSTFVMFLAAASFAVAVVTQLGVLLPDSGARGVMLEEGCEMLGFLLVLLGMTLHARYVILEATGELQGKRRGSRSAASESDDKRRRRTKVDGPHDSPPPPKRSDLDAVQVSRAATPHSNTAARSQSVGQGPLASRVSATSSRASYSDDDGDYDDEDGGSNRRIGRAERKAMRRARDERR